MSYVEAPFLIAVIREKEKSLLGDNEITRIMHAKSLADAREVLMSTPYAMFLSEGSSIQSGLTSALEHEFIWLERHLDNSNILAFIAARYDVLHVAQAVIALAEGEVHAPSTSRIGTVSHSMLQELVFTNSNAMTKEMKFWVSCIASQKDAIVNGTWSMPFLFASMQQVLEERLRSLASTPFMKTLAEQLKSRHESDRKLQEDRSRTDAARYEWEWDVQAIKLARSFRFEPVGYDPIIAYWITKEMERKTISLMFAALAGGFSTEETRSFIR